MATTQTISGLAAHLRIAVARTARRLRQEVGGLSPTLTAALATVDHHGPLTPSELAQRERVQRPTATRVLAPTSRFALALLGRVGPATAEVIDESKGCGEPRYAPGDELGLSGLQRAFQEQLAGITTCGRRSVIYSPEVLNAPGPPQEKKVFADATDYVVNDPLPRYAAWTDIDTIISGGLKRLWSGEATAKEVMAAIKREADPVLAPR